MAPMLTFVTNLVTNFGAACANPQFFGLKPWYYYLQRESVKVADTLPPQCVVHFNVLPSGGADAGKSDILLVLLAVVDDLLIAGGLVAIGFIIWGGAMYMTSQANPDQTQKAQHTIQNSLLGLAIIIMAISLVRFIAGRISA